MSGLKQQIEKKKINTDTLLNPHRKMDITEIQSAKDFNQEIDEILFLLADYEKDHFIFPIGKIKEMKLLNRVKILFSDYIIIKRKPIEDFLIAPNMGEWIRQNSPAPTLGDLLKRFIEEKVLGDEK